MDIGLVALVAYTLNREVKVTVGLALLVFLVSFLGMSMFNSIRNLKKQIQKRDLCIEYHCSVEVSGRGL